MTAALSMSGGLGRAERLAGDRSSLGRLAVAVLAVLLLVTMVISMTTGASGASALNLIGSWFGGTVADPVALLRDQTVIYNIRLPRMLTDSLLADVFDCLMQVNHAPASGMPFALPESVVRRDGLQSKVA